MTTDHPDILTPSVAHLEEACATLRSMPDLTNGDPLAIAGFATTACAEALVAIAYELRRHNDAQEELLT